ncbi:MAG TPA: stage V sporulation protein D [Firmicutes bacterium]|nr:stage V sporulation protein D [Bacillota bacterium]
MVKNKIHTRARVVFIAVTLVFFLVICKVFYIEVIEYNKLSKLAGSLWSRNLPITADRGEIYDRNGKVIATNITTTSLVFIPNQITDKEAVARDISKILGVDYEDILAHASKKTSIERVHPEGRQLSYEIAEKIDELNYDGVYLVKESKRYYPYKNLLSHTLGYVGIDNQGLSGLELYYDDYLTGVDGAIKYFSDGKGHRLNLEEVYMAPQSGMNLTLTIDLDLQLAVERELDNVIDMYDPEDALILAMNPKTGEILAMANRPDFDSNNYKDYSVETINRNLAIWKTYEPGSTFKITTLAASLEEREVNLFEEHYYDSGSIQVENARIKCWKAGGHGDQTFLNVVENSCNPGFVLLGQRLGTEKLYQYVNKFGFGKKTGIDLNGESSGILFKLENMGPVETATTAFGQGISVTPIQQVRAVSAVINGGELLKPYIVKTVSEPETNQTIIENKKTVDANVVSKETSDMVRYALESVVANGSGRNAYIENYRVGGKTGTAQKVENGAYLVGNYILSFIGFMPTDDPEIIVYVAVNNPKGVTQYGGTVSAPIAKNVLTTAIEIFDIDPDSEGLAKEYRWYEDSYIKLPDVTGMNVKEATKTLKDFKVEYSGTGETVLYMSPDPNIYVKKGSTVKLMLKD